jgi:hypothetical protein
MSKLHVLDSDGAGQFRVAIHAPVMTATNALTTLTWKATLLASGRIGTTCLTVGSGPGQITAEEAASIVAGDVMEIVTLCPLEGGGAATASLNASVADIVAAWKALQIAELRRYGQVVA